MAGKLLLMAIFTVISFALIISQTPEVFATTLFLNMTSNSGVGGTDYRFLAASSPSISDTTTSIVVKPTGKRYFDPGTASQSATGTPDSTPVGYGWASGLDSNYTGTIPAGMWTFYTNTTSSGTTGTGALIIDVYKTCNLVNTLLFGINNNTNLQSSTTSQLLKTTYSAPTIILSDITNRSCQIKVEYWINTTAQGGNGQTVNFQAGTTINNISFPTPINVIVNSTLNVPTSDPGVTTGNTFLMNGTGITDGSASGINMSFMYNYTGQSAFVDIPTTNGGLTINTANPQANIVNNTMYNRTITANTGMTYYVMVMVQNSTYSFNSSAQKVVVNSTLNLTVYNSSGMPDINTTITFLNSTNESQILGSGNGNVSRNLSGSQNYTILITKNISVSNLTAKIIKLNMTNSLNLTIQMASNYNGPNPSTASVSTAVFAFNDTGLSYENVTLYIPNNGNTINKILHCTDWNFTSGNCRFSDNWTVNSTLDYGMQQNSTHFWFNASKFEGFGGGSIYLEVRLIIPDPSVTATSLIQNYTFTINATVYCRGGSCGNVNGTAFYNSSSANPNTPINTTKGDKPFYIQESPALAMKSCPNNPLPQNQFCNITWTVNATGSINSGWKIGALLNSSDTSISQNHTSNATVTIQSCAVDMTTQFSSIDFGDLIPSTSQNNASGNAGMLYNITINPGSCNTDLYINSTDLTNTTLGSTIKAGNMTFGNTTNSYGNSFALSSAYQTIKLNVVPSSNVTTYYWLNMPAIYAGGYNGSMTITGVKNGNTPP